MPGIMEFLVFSVVESIQMKREVKAESDNEQIFRRDMRRQREREIIDLIWGEMWRFSDKDDYDEFAWRNLEK